MDHREIGQKLDLFMFHEWSPGCPIWLDKGTTIYNILIDKIRTLNHEYGYTEVRTPIIWKPDLYHMSGHWEHYSKNMFTIQDEDAAIHGDTSYVLKPMNCPGHMLIFKSKQFSYRDLPYRISDFGHLHRNETSGAIGGLTRCRAFCQDDGHVFVAGSPASIDMEVSSMIQMIQRVYKTFNMQLRVTLSTRPDSYLGSSETWKQAEESLANAIRNNQLAYTEDVGGGAFYGPKIDFFVTDSQKREWQTATIQLDYQLPERFDLKYNGGEDKDCRPVVIHRAVYGSFERFIGILLEHYQGHFPAWLSPIQVTVLTISDKHIEYAQSVVKLAKSHGVRVILDDSNLRISNKIRLAEEQKIPYIFVVGDNELSIGTVNVRFNISPELQPIRRVPEMSLSHEILNDIAKENMKKF